MFKITLLFFSVVIFYNQVRQCCKDSFSGKPAFAHGNPFKHTCHRTKWNIISAVKIKAVQIDCFFSNSAWSEFPAVFLIIYQFFLTYGSISQLSWFQNHMSFPLLRFGFISRQYLDSQLCLRCILTFSCGIEENPQEQCCQDNSHWISNLGSKPQALRCIEEISHGYCTHKCGRYCSDPVILLFAEQVHACSPENDHC